MDMFSKFPFIAIQMSKCVILLTFQKFDFVEFVFFHNATKSIDNCFHKNLNNRLTKNTENDCGAKRAHLPCQNIVTLHWSQDWLHEWT